MKKILITGGLGFIGKQLAHQLKKNFYVSVFDNLKTRIIKDPDIKIINGDINNLNDIKRATKNVDIVYHFAGVSNIDYSNEFYEKAIKTNILGTLNVIEACNKNSVKKIIYASSIYALSKQGGIYSVTKRTSEDLLLNLCNNLKIKYVILRFGSIYGLNSDKDNTILNLIDQGIKNKIIVRNGDGNEIRRYLSVKDTAKLCEEILKKRYENKFVNLLGKKKYKIKDVINIIKKNLNINSVIYKPDLASSYHYNKNPYTYQQDKGTNIFKNREEKFRDTIIEIIDNEIKK